MVVNADPLEVQRRDRELHGSGILAALKSLEPEIKLVTYDDIQRVWEGVRHLTAVFPEPDFNYEASFKEVLLAKDTHAFLVEPGGVIWFTDVSPGNHAFFNGAIWDRVLYGRQDLARKILDFVFDQMQLHRITAAIASTNKLAAQYAEALGFKFEGRLTDFVWHPDGRTDLLYYGLLRKEYENGGSSSRRGSGSVLERVGPDDRGPGSVSAERREGVVREAIEPGVGRPSTGAETGAECHEGADQGQHPTVPSGDAGPARPARRWGRRVFAAIRDWAAERADQDGGAGNAD